MKYLVMYVDAVGSTIVASCDTIDEVENAINNRMKNPSFSNPNCFRIYEKMTNFQLQREVRLVFKYVK